MDPTAVDTGSLTDAAFGFALAQVAGLMIAAVADLLKLLVLFPNRAQSIPWCAIGFGMASRRITGVTAAAAAARSVDASTTSVAYDVSRILTTGPVILPLVPFLYNNDAMLAGGVTITLGTIPISGSAAFGVCTTRGSGSELGQFLTTSEGIYEGHSVIVVGACCSSAWVSFELLPRCCGAAVAQATSMHKRVLLRCIVLLHT